MKKWYHNGSDTTDHPQIVRAGKHPLFFDGPFSTFQAAKNDMVNGYFAQVQMYRYALKLARNLKKETKR